MCEFRCQRPLVVIWNRKNIWLNQRNAWSKYFWFSSELFCSFISDYGCYVVLCDIANIIHIILYCTSSSQMQRRLRTDQHFDPALNDLFPRLAPVGPYPSRLFLVWPAGVAGYPVLSLLLKPLCVFCCFPDSLIAQSAKCVAQTESCWSGVRLFCLFIYLFLFLVFCSFLS